MNIFGRKQQVTYVDVVREFGLVLEKPARGAALTRRMAELPYEMGLIKEAICQLAVDGGGSATRDQLKAGFMQLAAFIDQEPAPALPHLPSDGIGGNLKTEFLEEVISTLGSAEEQSKAVTAKIAQLAHEFEARCKFIEVAANV